MIKIIFKDDGPKQFSVVRVSEKGIETQLDVAASVKRSEWPPITAVVEFVGVQIEYK